MGFPEQLKKARIAMGYTQQQVADAMGITDSTYCGYETGKRQPDVHKIKQLAQILNTSGDFLLETGFEPREEPQTTKAIKSILESLNPSAQVYLLKMAEELLIMQERQSNKSKN